MPGGSQELQTQEHEDVDASSPVAHLGERLILEREDAVTIIERLRETRVSADGHAFLLRLDALIVRLGTRWESKSELVFEHLKTGFERRFEEPNWCLKINDDAWLAIIPGVGSRRGALTVAEIWRDLGGFFVGDVSALEGAHLRRAGRGCRPLHAQPH
ncbi:MAG: hypothetical protein QM667_05615 [Asticcacaulis sp.]